MKTIDDILDEICEDRPQDLHEQTVPAATDPNEEEIEELLFDCHSMLDVVLQQELSPEVSKEVAALRLRLNEVLCWNTFH